MKEASQDSKEKSIFCAKVALEKKALDITILELKNISSLTDYFVICSGRSDRQVQAIAEFIEEQMGKNGFSTLGVEGMKEGRWVLMDYADVVIHIFYEPVRLHYDLEGLWIEAPRINPPEAKG